MTKKELVDQVATASGISQVTARKVIEETMNAIKESVKQDVPVILRGFGTFSLEMVAAKKVRDFKNGSLFIRPASKKVKFKAYDDFLN